MAKEMTNKLRAEVEKLIYDVLDALDKTKTNSEHYKAIFAKMSNKEFQKYISQDFPYRFHTTPFKIEPTMRDAKNALDILGVPLLERVTSPYTYQDAEGRAVTSKECLVGYMHLKKVQQFITKKNAMSVDIAQRDMKTGLLLSHDKNGKESDREFESLTVNGLDATLKEFSTIRADSMNAKNLAYNTINTTGAVSLDEIPIEPVDSLSRNLMNVYMIGAGIYTDVINQDYYLPYTLSNKKKEMERK